MKPEANLVPCQTAKMEVFAKTFNGFKQMSIFAKIKLVREYD